MSTAPRRNLAVFLLVFGAVVFGMILAGGLELTAPGSARPESAALSATQIANSHPTITALPSFADLAEAVDPAVVSIQAATIERASANRRREPQGPFDFFLDPRFRQPQNDDEEQRRDSGGSGFVISSDGLVVTNFHVVDGATSVKVHLGDRDYPAEIKGADQATDLALLKIDAGKDLRYLELGNSDQVRVGDWVMVVGNPLSLDKTVTTGVVSAKGRAIGVGDISFENFIQTDAAINFGNSGGPLINLKGEVVGIATAINYGAENIGFAVPVNTLKEVLPQLKEKGKVSRGYLGINIGNLDYQTAKAFGLDEAAGALVISVEKETPAGKAGIVHGDVILSVDQRKIKTTRDLIDYVSSKGPNATVTLDILREGEKLAKKVKLGERPPAGPSDEAPIEQDGNESGIEWLGIEYQDLSPNLRNMHGLPEDLDGVFVTEVAPSSPLYEQGVRPGTVLSEVNGKDVDSAAGFEKAVKEVKSGAYIRFYGLRIAQRQTAPFFAVVQAP
jgi:serine protease Do